MIDAEVTEILIFAYDDELVFLCMLPNRTVGGTHQAYIGNMDAARISVSERLNSTSCEIFVEKKFG